MRKLFLSLIAIGALWLGPRAAVADRSSDPVLGDVAGILATADANAKSLPTAHAKFQMPDDPWKRVKTPTKPPSESIGGYSAGCLRGAQALEITGRGFQVMRLSRKRWFGHPRLLDYLRNFAAAAKAKNLGTILVGDMGQPRGGPTMSGHASHQTGLDADVWFIRTPAGKVLTPEEREKLSAPSMVIGEFDSLSPNWDPTVMDVLKVAASDPHVARIFVNPIIKKEVCAHHGGEDWVGRLRPWWEHKEHFHVRLSCAPGDARCKAQEEAPAGDGCGSDLASWFTPEKRKEAEDMKKNPSPPKMPTLPAACQKVLTE